MLSSITVRAGELLAAVVVAGAVLVAASAAGAWWLSRRVRRRLGAVGSAAAARARRAVAGRAAGRWRLWSVPLPDRRWLAAARRRRGLWRAVRAAERSVALAREAGAPAGELQALCRQLRGAAGDADRLLAMPRPARSAGSPGSVSARADDLIAIAGQIQAAAAGAAVAMSRPAVGGLADDVRREAEALSAGIVTAVDGAWASARSAAVR
jgi:hypothetical protein